MKKVNLIFILVSLAISFLCFIATNNLIYTAILFVIFIAYYFLILRNKIKQYYSLVDRVHTCYHFINSFLITLSVKESYEDAYQSGIRLENKALLEQTHELENMSVYDRVKYLRSFFNLAIYKMFLNILDLYQDQGGNILNMSDNLLRECTRTEKILSETRSIGIKHLVEFVVLWGLSFGILLFIKFGISDFYEMMTLNSSFLPMIYGFFYICLLSIHLFFTKFTNLTIKEDSGS